MSSIKILISPDKFKGSLGAREVAANIEVGLREVLPVAQIRSVPVADGGEGTAAVIANALNATLMACPAHDPLGREITARYAWLNPDQLAIMEMSEAAGLRRLTPDERDPVLCSTFGVGEMLRHATMQGASEVIIGLGGSATNDGGTGLARALGYQFLDGRGRDLPSAVTQLIHLEKIVSPNERTWPPIIIAADVKNPLLGENGATSVFASQKGATSDQINALEKALRKLAAIAARDLQNNFSETPGAGAAGGLGFGLLTFSGATIRSGFEVVAEKIHLDEIIRDFDVVITGEGSLDRQTLEGKAPAGVAKLARKLGKRVFAIVGRSSGEPEVESLFRKVFTLTRFNEGESDGFSRAPELLRERARELARML